MSEGEHMYIYIVVEKRRAMPPGAQEWRDSYVASWNIGKVFADRKRAEEHIKGKCGLRIVRRKLVE